MNGLNIGIGPKKAISVDFWKESFPSKESDTKILQNIQFAY